MLVMEEETRAHLAIMKSGFNQIRNSIYYLQRFMKQHNLTTNDIEDHLFRMGTNIGKTISRELSPKSGDISEILINLYQFILYSRVSVIKTGSIVKVEDHDCALCKYRYSDIEVPGCNITLGMITELLHHYGFNVEKQVIEKSRIWGDDVCVHTFELNVPMDCDESRYGIYETSIFIIYNDIQSGIISRSFRHCR
jgi:hypothetical protein